MMQTCIRTLPCTHMHAKGAIRPFTRNSPSRNVLKSACTPSSSLLHRRAVRVSAILKSKTQVLKKQPDTIVPDPSYNIPATLLALSGFSFYENSVPLGVLFGILGVFLGVQATRVRFRFEKDALEVTVGETDDKTENAFVGGRNRWSYDTFVNWEFWWPEFPVLVYFKETQTKPEGQIHFFPIIFNGKQLYDVMVQKCGPSQNSGPQ